MSKRENPLLEKVRQKIESRSEALVRGEAAPPPLSGDELGNDVDELRNTIVELQKQLTFLGVAQKRQAEETERLKERLAEREKELTAVRKQAGELHSAAAAKDKLIEDLRDELEQVRSTMGSDDRRSEEMRRQQAVVLAELERLREENAKLQERLSFYEGKTVVTSVPNPYDGTFEEVIETRDQSGGARIVVVARPLETQLTVRLQQICGMAFKFNKQDVVNICVLAGMNRLVLTDELEEILAPWANSCVARRDNIKYREILEALYLYLLDGRRHRG